MGKMQRRKGYRVENKLVNQLKAAGLKAHRVPLSGGNAGYPGDIKLGDKLCEVKARANGQGFATIDRWLSGNDYLFLKRDRRSPLVVMRFNEFLELKKADD